MNRIIHPNYNNVYFDQTRWETILDDTGYRLDLYPSCQFAQQTFTEKYRVNVNHRPKGRWKISRADLADFIVKQLSSNEFIHRKPVIAY
ncbi:MAG: hypothetical protein C0490_07640 [Marivirga sp.]|nr:hypothetical protein [Marivirga sp.]